ncbi:hypothetical protein IAT38_004089 [Cryptococcus sp. DSM 104549]
MSSSDKIVLITGANRGVGLGIAKVFLAKGWTVVAAVRNPTTMPALEGKLITVKVEAASYTDATEAVEELKTKHNITRLDVVIANAGISDSWTHLNKIKPAILDRHYEVNVRGPLVLYQAVYPLLQEGAKFTVISSLLGSNSMGPEWRGFGGGLYGAAKAAVNYLVREIHFEEPKLTAFIIFPGFVETDMGRVAAASFGIEKTPQIVDEVTPLIFDLIEKATKETHGGLLWNYDGEKGAW